MLGLSLFIVLGGLAIIIFLALMAGRSSRQGDPRAAALLQYAQCRPLSEPEQVLYWRLVEALPECVVLPQVSFSRFMRPAPAKRVPRWQYRALYARISQKTIDFLVCLKDFTVVAAVELDDSSHERRHDLMRDELLQSAGIQPLRVHVREIPSAQQLREMFTKDPSKGESR
jgi:hypothetical protein